jgi:hypothetical protein
MDGLQADVLSCSHDNVFKFWVFATSRWNCSVQGCLEIVNLGSYLTRINIKFAPQLFDFLKSVTWFRMKRGRTDIVAGLCPVR